MPDSSTKHIKTLSLIVFLFRDRFLEKQKQKQKKYQTCSLYCSSFWPHIHFSSIVICLMQLYWKCFCKGCPSASCSSIEQCGDGGGRGGRGGAQSVRGFRWWKRVYGGIRWIYFAFYLPEALWSLGAPSPQISLPFWLLWYHSSLLSSLPTWLFFFLTV